MLRRAAGYLIARDLDDDGLVETFRDGNGNNQFGDTVYDTISSGWGNVLVNGQAHKTRASCPTAAASTWASSTSRADATPS